MNPLKKIIYSINTELNTKRLVKGLKHRLLGDQDMYLVHQMGRVASMTMVNTLRKALPDTPIYHTHYLNLELLRSRIADMGRQRLRHNQRHYQVSLALAPVLKQYLGQHRWKIVTVVRDPVARNVSAFFLSIDRYIPDFYRRFDKKEISVTQVVDTFLLDYPHNVPLQWLDDEIGEPFGLDVYKEPFPLNKGYAVLHHNTVDLLILRLESLQTCYREAFLTFAGIEDASLQDTHITKKDDTKGAYKSLLSAMQLPEEYLDTMYSSKYAAHFFSAPDLVRLKHKWLNAS